MRCDIAQLLYLGHHLHIVFPQKHSLLPLRINLQGKVRLTSKVDLWVYSTASYLQPPHNNGCTERSVLGAPGNRRHRFYRLGYPVHDRNTTKMVFACPQSLGMAHRRVELIRGKHLYAAPDLTMLTRSRESASRSAELLVSPRPTAAASTKARWQRSGARGASSSAASFNGSRASTSTPSRWRRAAAASPTRSPLRDACIWNCVYG